MIIVICPIHRIKLKKRCPIRDDYDERCYQRTEIMTSTVMKVRIWAKKYVCTIHNKIMNKSDYECKGNNEFDCVKRLLMTKLDRYIPLHENKTQKELLSYRTEYQEEYSLPQYKREERIKAKALRKNPQIVDKIKIIEFIEENCQLRPVKKLVLGYLNFI